MTKMAAMLMYSKKPFKNLQNLPTDFHETWYVVSGLLPIIICSNDDPGLTLTYFKARSNFVKLAFLWEKGKKVDYSETIAACDLKQMTLGQGLDITLTFNTHISSLNQLVRS